LKYSGNAVAGIQLDCNTIF